MSVVASKYIEKLKGVFSLLGHTHSEYATSSHTHSNYSTTSHTHTPASIGAAASSHTHSEYLAASVIPSGAIMWFYLQTAPSGWKVCDGNNGTPNLIGKYPLGANVNDIGGEVSAGLPDLQCYLQADKGFNCGTDGLVSYAESASGSGGSGSCSKFLFKASNCNSIYGKSTTVTPPSIKLLPCMKI